MKTKIFLFAIVLAACNSQTEIPVEESVSPDFYRGSWALDLEYDNNTAGWLEVRQEEGYLDAELLWRWGSVTPVEFIFVTGNRLVVTQGREVIRERDENGEPVRTHHALNWLNIKKVGEDEIAGTGNFPGTDGVTFNKVNFTGKRIPDAGSPPDLSSLTYGEPVNLIGNNDLSGWELLEEGAVNGWSVNNGVLENNPVQVDGEEHKHYGNLRTTDTFEDFNLSLEVNVPEGSNSGVYLRGIYEIQVSDSYGREANSHHMGALYSRIAPSATVEKPAGEWQEMEITLCLRHLTVKLNGTTIIDNQPVEGITGGAITADEFIPGPIYLQGDHGAVAYRNMVIREIE